MKEIKTILIANRGEPVRRAIRTFRRLGIQIVTIATADDLSCDWVAEGDKCLTVSSYLSGDEIVEMAKDAGVDAIWPGWGFLSENAGFARMVQESGLIWIGPPADVIDQMASKSEATRIAKKAGLSTIPEVSLDVSQNPEGLINEVQVACTEIGYPILLKPALGGGGQGQLVVTTNSELEPAWKQVVQLNAKQFGSGPILIQKYFTDAKHIETQILADQQGSVVVLGERECSVQRRNQKVIEESPSPALTDVQRAGLIELSSEFARTVGYQNAGTIEFLYSNGEFYFLEMNTRLQVEHSITEETTFVNNEKIDLVAEMLRVAQGEDLRFNQSQILRRGHAVETRVYAEEPEQDYRPAPGTVSKYQFPNSSHLRIETAFSQYPFTVSAQYDPMIAKIIAMGDDRQEAIDRMVDALLNTVILGVPSNLELCERVLRHPEFLDGSYSTRFLAHHQELRSNIPERPGLALIVASVIRYQRDLEAVRAALRSEDPTSYRHLFRQIPQNGVVYDSEYQGKVAKIAVFEQAPRSFEVVINDQRCTLELIAKDRLSFTCLLPSGDVFSVWSDQQGDDILLNYDGESSRIRLQREGDEQIIQDPHASPLAGQIVSLSVKPGDEVKEGQELYQIESMKMITMIAAARKGIVEEVSRAVGDPIRAGDLVVKIPMEEENLGDDGHAWQTDDLGPMPAFVSIDPQKLIQNYFTGFDVTQEKFDVALARLEEYAESGILTRGELAQSVAQNISTFLKINDLFEENEHVLTFVAEQDQVAVDHLPREQVVLMQEVLSYYGLKDLSDLAAQPRYLIHLFQAHGHGQNAKENNLIRLIQICFEHRVVSESITSALVTWLKRGPKIKEEARNDIWAYLFTLDPDTYYQMANTPVALEYLGEYKTIKKNPAYGLDQNEYHRLLSEIGIDTEGFVVNEEARKRAHFEVVDFSKFPEKLRPHLNKWFADYHGRLLSLPKLLADRDVYLYELIPSQDDNDIPPRFVVFALVSGKNDSQTTSLKSVYERAAIDAYRALRLVQLGEIHRPNNVFILSKDGQPLPWRTRDHDQISHVITPNIARASADRVAGFAQGIKIEATEIVLPLLNEEDAKVYWSVIEIRHSSQKGVISRPPFPLKERAARHPKDIISQMNDRQHRMGKLLNSDRATLLFDRGEFEELLFPEVDDEPGIGLNVYQGTVNGLPTLAYGGDFRFRGGALGEREGKKLASAVVLAYLSNRPLVAFHDGAGANIKESIASLGWAGAYFGAIAHTGGFSNPEKFKAWLKGHIDRDYFEKVLQHFGFNKPLDEVVDGVQRQLLHFHLHVGATVGMLVYGASIAHASLMCDQPESYRVLTGASTVKKVLGERATNYSLGGAKAHSEESGDIEMTFETEEQVIGHTRKLIQLFFNGECCDQIMRDPKLPVLDVPKRAGIIMGRAAIRSHVDGGVFYEIRPNLKKARGLLTGYASLAGQPVAVVATTTDYGLAEANSFKKATLLIEAAQDLSLPVILISGAQWESPSAPVPADWLAAREEFYNALKRADVAKLSLALGPRSIELAIHQQMDICLYVNRGDESCDETERLNRLTPLVCKSIADGFDRLANLLRYLQKTRSTTDSPERQANFELPTELTQAYKMRSVIADVFDKESFFELWPEDKLPLITGFASLGGVVVGVIADDPQVEGGAQNIDSIQKFTRLNRLCERFHIPIVELNDSPAFRPGQEQEHSGIQGVGGRSIREECLNAIPKVAVTLRQNYGGRLIHANLITLGPNRAGLILEGAKVGVMGAKGAVGVLYGKKLVALPESERADAEARWQKEYEDKQLNPENAIKLGYVEGPIQVPDLRERIFRVLKDLVN